MRIGYNPHKNKVKCKSEYFHHIIVPVYIPTEEGYFKDSFKILQYCLDSLFKTTHPKTYITVVNNGSNSIIVEYLNSILNEKKIHEVIHTSNIGKLNSILKGIMGHDFPFITIADSDVLFLNSWQEETYKVFEIFPKAGAVCTTPSSKSLKSNTFNIWFELLFSKTLGFTEVKNSDALKVFALSVGNPNMYNSENLKKYLTVTNSGFRAVVGAGHFMTTYRKEVFEKDIVKYSNFMLGGDSEAKLLDIPVIKCGMWRLSTEGNFTYHMGNVREDWMREKLEEIKPNTFFPAEPVFTYKVRTSKAGYLFKNKIFSRFLTRKKIWNYCLRLKGLSKDEAIKYTINQ